ncbi:MAG: MoaD/ThiS family protein [Chloroflexota bacterium]
MHKIGLSKNKVRLEILPWIAGTCGFRGPGRLMLEEQIEEGATIGILLRKIAGEHQSFKDVIFDASGRRLSGFVSIVLNDRFVDLLDGLDTPVKDGDTIVLFPVIEGG